MSKTQGNLTEGPILKVLTKLALPIMASAFLGTAYNITDMAWVGKLGSKAIAGVGVGGMYVWLSSGLAALSRMGGQVYVAQSLGKGEREEAKAYASASIWLSIFFGLLFGAVSVLFANPLVSFFQLDDPMAIAHAKVYLQIACGLVVFSFVLTAFIACTSLLISVIRMQILYHAFQTTEKSRIFCTHLNYSRLFVRYLGQLSILLLYHTFIII